MKYFSPALRRSCPAFGVVAIAVICAILASAQNAPGEFTFTGGDGMTATLSDYSLTDAGVDSSGNYRGTYCFTLTNTSDRGIYIGAIGLSNEEPSDYFLVSEQDNTARFIYDQSVEELFGTFPTSLSVSAVLRADGYPESISNAIPPRGSVSFCVTLTRARPFTLEEVLNRTTLLFGVQYQFPLALYATEPDLELRVFVTTYLVDGKTCFSVSNWTTETITGIAFRATEYSGEFRLVNIEPRPQPNDQSFVFKSPAYLFPDDKDSTETAQYYDFGFLTGRSLNRGNERKGLRPRQHTSTFCLQGYLYGASGDTIYLPTGIWFGDGTQFVFSSYRRLEHERGLLGTVATIAR